MSEIFLPQTDQARFWNGPASDGWVSSQEVLDRLLVPFLEVLVEAIPEGAALKVLDVGCGTGASTLAFAEKLGPGGLAVGVDVSKPMLELAQARARTAASKPRFVLADAATHPFEDALFDLILSRFGVMFFEDPVAAFSHLRNAVREGGALLAIAWRSMAENGFMIAAERAAAPYLPALPPRNPDAPGQFAFADGEKVRKILMQSGWRQISVSPIDIACQITEQDLLEYAAQLGPVGRLLPETDAKTRALVEDKVHQAFAPFRVSEGYVFTAACWRIEAEN